MSKTIDSEGPGMTPISITSLGKYTITRYITPNAGNLDMVESNQHLRTTFF